MSSKKTTFEIRFFLFGYKIIKFFPKLAILCYKFFNLILKAYEGIWLGLLKRESIHEINETFYNKQKLYFTDEHNKSGLFLWEKYVIEKNFKEKKLCFYWLQEAEEKYIH